MTAPNTLQGFAGLHLEPKGAAVRTLLEWRGRGDRTLNLSSAC